jgi:hypothetical protein
MGIRENIDWLQAVGAYRILHPKLVQLAYAIQQFEGWYKGSLSYRNNNPGNLKWSPLMDELGLKKSDGFVKFQTYMQGLFALLHDLHSKCLGKTSTNLGPKSTVLELFKTYAPASDKNNPEGYAKFVVGKIDGATLDTELGDLVSGD